MKPRSGDLHIDERGPGAPVGRRVALGLFGLGALGVVAGSRVQNGLLRVIAPVATRDPTGLISMFPVGDQFRFYSVAAHAPRRNAVDYRLDVSGLVSRPAGFTLADLTAMPQTSLVRDFQCVTGWRVPEVPWGGVRLSQLLDAVGPLPGATAVRFISFDGVYSESLTMEQARRPDVLVALSMLHGPVSRYHGGPVRLFVAPMYGYKSLKWLGGIEVTAGVIAGYWEQHGYDIDAWVGRSNGRDDDATT
jgi:DMSO/TMAO reductase YedYZ molybdopterin-dependent catalytic subunit